MATEAKPKAAKNFYQQALNDPELLKRRADKQAELDREVAKILKENPKQIPKWEPERLMQMDRFCLKHSKRCIMWDDDGAGFYLMLNWDWLKNRPSEPRDWEHQMAVEQGWYLNVRKIMRLPLLDTSLPEDKLAAWIDENTMRVHVGLLDKLDKLRWDQAEERLVLDDPYWRELEALPPWTPNPPVTPARPPSYASGLNPPPDCAAAYCGSGAESAAD